MSAEADNREADNREADHRVEAIARDIEAYLAVHPDAADSAEGIQRWWLAHSPTEDSLDQVRTALDRLAEAGRVTRRVLPDGGVMYSGPGPHPDTGQ